MVKEGGVGSDSALESAMAAAARDELGALLDSWQTGNWRLAKGKEILYRFEHGLVLDRGARKGSLALPYRDLRIYREYNPTLSDPGVPLFQWTFERGDGQAWITLVNEGGKEGKKQRGIRQMCHEALGQACARQREAAMQRLSEGATLAFGPVELDRSQITFRGQQTASWASVIELSVKRKKHWPHLVVKAAHDGGFLPVRLDANVGHIPNFPLLWELAHLAHANAQAAQ